MAAEEVGYLAAVEGVDYFSKGSLLDSALKLVEEHRYELLNVLLDHNVYGLSERLVGKAEICWNIVHAGRKLQIAEYPL